MEIIVFNFGENKERYHEKLKFLGPVLGLVILLSGCAKWIDQGNRSPLSAHPHYSR